MPLDYNAPGCICANGGMGRHTDCPIHGLAALEAERRGLLERLRDRRTDEDA